MAEGKMWNLVIFQMIYQTIDWKTRLYWFAVSRVWRLIRTTLRVVIVSLFQDTYSWSDNKRVIVKFVNRNHSEILLYKKKSISSKDFSNINIPSKIFVFVSLCPYYRFIWGKCKDFQRRGKIHQSGNPLKISHVTDIPTFNDEDE